MFDVRFYTVDSGIRAVGIGRIKSYGNRIRFCRAKTPDKMFENKRSRRRFEFAANCAELVSTGTRRIWIPNNEVLRSLSGEMLETLPRTAPKRNRYK